MKTYDCFLFFDEFDLLELRLETLYDHVDVFVLVESKFTFTGNPKPLYFLENRDRFKKWSDKIRHVIIQDRFESENTWQTEYRDRNQIGVGLFDAEPEDLIFVSDCDEIWDPEKKLFLVDQNFPIRYMATLSYYFLNLRRVNFSSGRCTARTHFRNFKDAQSLRSNQNCIKLENSSWHFSYIADADRIIKKIQAFSHTEYNTPYFTDKDRIIEKIKEGKDLLDRDAVYKAVPVDHTFPKPIQENPDRWKNFLKDL
jgi:beta-1,4-mannosyl-glycoprotein beta-1,4-N-acetylglucosaminyltransferase